MKILITIIILALTSYLNTVVSQSIDGCEAKFSYEINVNNNVVEFTDISSVDSTAEYQLDWTFQGAVVLTSSGAKSRVQYREEGTYPVCLTISTNNCSSTVCEFIQIKRPSAQSCELDVQANINAESHSGFGDGSISLDVSGGAGEYYYSWNINESSYSISDLNPGQYCVYITDGENCSKDTCFLVEPALQCQADFNHSHVEECINCVYFHNYSTPVPLSQIWDFGDGTFSSEINPAHYFQEVGTYEVCLTIYSENDCVDTYCQEIIIADSLHDIFGYVLAGDYYLPEGVVILFEENEDASYSAVDYSIIDEYGSYYFYDLHEANYLTYAIPYFDLPYVFTPIFLPTYFGDALYWQDASSILLNDDFYYADIFLSSYDEILYGEGSISGELLCGSQSSYENDIYSVDWFNTGISTTENHVINMPVLLLNESGQAINYQLSDDNALFNFENLEHNTYKIYTEKAGMETIAPVLTIDNETQNIEGIQILIGDSEISSIYDELYNYYNSMISVYPNPISDYIFIKFDDNIKNDIQVSITNSIGQQILLEEISSTDVNVKTINVSTLTSGVYILNLIVEDRVISKKIVK